jgi:uncharacterized membrane protein
MSHRSREQSPVVPAWPAVALAVALAAAVMAYGLRGLPSAKPQSAAPFTVTRSMTPQCSAVVLTPLATPVGRGQAYVATCAPRLADGP